MPLLTFGLSSTTGHSPAPRRQPRGPALSFFLCAPHSLAFEKLRLRILLLFCFNMWLLLLLSVVVVCELSTQL